LRRSIFEAQFLRQRRSIFEATAKTQSCPRSRSSRLITWFPQVMWQPFNLAAIVFQFFSLAIRSLFKEHSSELRFSTLCIS
jgi:hypothetical protein